MEKVIALEQLGQSRASLANAQRIARLGSWELDLGSGETKWSDEVYRILGLIPTNTTPSLESLKKCIHADDRSRFAGLIERSMKTGKPFSADNRIVMPDGAIRFVHQQGEVVKNPGTMPDIIKCIIIDITEREMAAAEIRKLNVDLERRVADRTNKLTREINERNKAEIRSKSERARAEKYLDIAGTIIVALDKNGRIEMINKKGCDVLGYEESELLGRDWFSAVLPIDISNAVRTLYGQLVETNDNENTFQNKIVTKSGEHRIISWENTTLKDEQGRASGVLSAGMDITDQVNAENKIISSERLYRSILSTTSQGYWLIDGNSIIKDVNPALCKMLGYSKKEMIGTSAISFVDEECRKVYSNHQQDNKTNKQKNYEIALNHKNGHRIHAQINATKMDGATNDDAFSANDAFAFINDITEQKRIEVAIRNSEERFRAIADYTYDWESWIGVDGNPVWVNPAVERICGYTADECLSMADYPLPLVFRADLKIVKQMIDDSLNGGISNDTEFRIKAKSGKIVWVAASYQPIFDVDGKQNGSRWSTRDISVRKAITAQLILAKDSAEAANRAKSGFLSNMSHELRTPLNAILGFSQMLDAEIDSKLSSSQKEYVGYVLKSGSHLLNLINEILDLSKIEAGAIDLNIDHIATDEIINDTIVQLGAATAERNIKIANNANAKNTPITMADGVRLKQVLTNIISNAV
ncbi:MAG: PAS domain S-box protein, partial [Rhodospirillaceae bacterium]|nr:PAS domain S-box protein [Rhodospirillaceae bacterium]